MKDSAGTESGNRCPLCGSLSLRPAFRKSGYFYHRCRQCRHVFVWPLPTAEETAAHYKNAYSPIHLEQSRAWFEVLARKRVEITSRYADRPGRLLDIGCGYGHFLAEANRNGWQAQGIDSSGYPLGYARSTFDLDVEEGEIPEALQLLPEGGFDAVTMWHVLEHVESPGETIREARRLLAGNGILVLNSPNLDSAIFKLVRKHWSWIYTPGHLQYFDRPGLETYLTRQKFQVLTSETWTDAPNLYFLVEEALLLMFTKVLNRLRLRLLARAAKQIQSWSYGEVHQKKVQAALRKVYERTPGLDARLRFRNQGHEFLIVARKSERT